MFKKTLHHRAYCLFFIMSWYNCDKHSIQLQSGKISQYDYSSTAFPCWQVYNQSCVVILPQVSREESNPAVLLHGAGQAALSWSKIPKDLHTEYATMNWSSQ